MPRADGVVVRLQGVDDLLQALSLISAQLRKKVLLSALRKAAGVIRTEARSRAPVLQKPNPYRTKGLVKKRITVRISKISRRAGDVGVFVGVKPAKLFEQGAKSRVDPYYWWWNEYGTVKQGAKPFLTPASQKLPEALAVFEAAVIPAIEKFNRRKGPA